MAKALLVVLTMFITGLAFADDYETYVSCNRLGITEDENGNFYLQYSKALHKWRFLYNSSYAATGWIESDWCSYSGKDAFSQWPNARVFSCSRGWYGPGVAPYPENSGDCRYSFSDSTSVSMMYHGQGVLFLSGDYYANIGSASGQACSERRSLKDYGDLAYCYIRPKD